MDKNKVTKVEAKECLKVLSVAQKIRDYCANTFQEEHLKVNETVWVLGAVCGQHCREIEALCEFVKAEDAMERLFEVIKRYIEYDEGEAEGDDKNV